MLAASYPSAAAPVANSLPCPKSEIISTSVNQRSALR
jgi:hypothetical protein